MAIDGDIKFSAFPGSSDTTRSRERTLVRALNYRVERPSEPSHGSRLTGFRAHKPFKVTCDIDRAAPEIFSRLTTGKKIDEVEVRLWRPDADGAERAYMTFVLSNVRVVGVEFIQLHNLQSNALELATPAMVEYEFVFADIEVEYDDGRGAVVASDSWLKRGLRRMAGMRRRRKERGANPE